MCQLAGLSRRGYWGSWIGSRLDEGQTVRPVTQKAAADYRRRKANGLSKQGKPEPNPSFYFS
jgi:hypothetical protein